jgi:hypothetical protein
MAVRLLSRCLTLTPADSWVVARACLWLGLVDLGLRLAGFQWVVRWAEAPSRPSADALPIERWQRARRYAFWIAVVARHHPARARCLQRSLVLQRWLRQEGVPSILRIGVRKEGTALRAHAWVELDGQVVNDLPAAVAAFQPLRPAGAAPAGSLAWRDLGGLSWS